MVKIKGQGHHVKNVISMIFWLNSTVSIADCKSSREGFNATALQNYMYHPHWPTQRPGTKDGQQVRQQHFFLHSYDIITD